MIVRVYLDGYDITRWVKRASWSQAPRTIHMAWSLTVSAMLDVDWTQSEVAIYGSYTSADALEPIITGGRVPPDQPPQQRFGGGPVTVEVSGFDWVYFAQRRVPEVTLVYVGQHDSESELIRDAELPVGRYRVLRKLGSRIGPTGLLESSPWLLHEVVQSLASYAGFGACVVMLPKVEMAPFIADPTQSYFNVLTSLLEPLKAEMYFRHEWGGIIVSDPLAYPTVVGNPMLIRPRSIARAVGAGTRRRSIKRILVLAPQTSQRPFFRV